MSSTSSTTNRTPARARLGTTLALGEHRVTLGERFALLAVVTPTALTLDWFARELVEPLARFSLSLEPRLRTDLTVTLPDDEALRTRYEARVLAALSRSQHRSGCFRGEHRADTFGDVWNEVVATGQAVEPKLRRRELRRVRALLGRCEAWATSQLPPEAIEFAKRFRPDTRAWVIDELRHDASGRIRQALEVCPGLAHVGLLLRDEQRDDLWRVAAEELIRGRKLNQVIDDLIEASRSGPGSFGDDATTRVRQAVRCAGPRVARFRLQGRFPSSICWADAPREPDANAVWFEVVGYARVTQDDRFGETAVCAFASAHGVALDQALGGRPASLRRFFVWCRSTRRFPSRRSDPVRLVREARAGRRAQRAQDRAADAARARRATDRTPFPSPPFPDGVDGPLFASAVRDATELQAHALEMDHCVFDQHVERAVAGEDCIYACSYEAVRFTLAVRREEDKWCFLEARGVSNRPLTAPGRDALDAWLASRGIERDGCQVHP